MNEFKTSFHNADQSDDTNNDWSDQFLGSNRIRQMITSFLVSYLVFYFLIKTKFIANLIAGDEYKMMICIDE